MQGIRKSLAIVHADQEPMVSNQLIPEERRLRSRYPLNLSVSFRCMSEKSHFSGAGRAVNVSSGGILVVCQHVASELEISVGARMEVNIQWPSLLDGRIPLQLFAAGQVLRRGEYDFAATFEQYQFRTMRSSSSQRAHLGGDPLEWPPAPAARVRHGSPTDFQA